MVYTRRVSAVQKRRQAVELVIGYHKLEGKVVPLQKPLAMLQKHCGSGGEGACAQALEYKVQEGCWGFRFRQLHTSGSESLLPQLSRSWASSERSASSRVDQYR